MGPSNPKGTSALGPASSPTTLGAEVYAGATIEAVLVGAVEGLLAPGTGVSAGAETIESSANLHAAAFVLARVRSAE